jgi:hypothetical protein
VGDAAAKLYLRLGLAGVASFAVLLFLLHVLNWDGLAEHGRHVSNFYWMRAGVLWNVGLVGLGGGLLLVVQGLEGTLPVRGPATWSFWTLRLAGVLILAMVVFPTDRYLTPDANTSLGGYIHDTCAVLSTFFICWSMLAMVAAARVDAAWRGIPGRSWLLPLGTIGLALAWMGGDVTEYWRVSSFVQRGVVAAMTAWVLMVGSRALSVQALPAGTPQPTPPPRPTR